MNQAEYEAGAVYAARAIEEGDFEAALTICNRLLYEWPDDPKTLFLIGAALAKCERAGMALAIFHRVARLAPDAPGVANNIAKCLQDMQRYAEAERALQVALKQEPDSAMIMANMALVRLNQQDPEGAIAWADKAIAIDPLLREVRDTRGMACLRLGRWGEGWDGYSHSVGNAWRRTRAYPGVETWQGDDGKNVIAYGEQGIGDELMFASCIPDLISRSLQVIIETEPRLVGLFKRSFPRAKVHGTRYQPIESLRWVPMATGDIFGDPLDGSDDDGANLFDWYAVPFGELPRFYRRTSDAFPRKPYLKPDPERVAQWGLIFSGKKATGIAWTGGRLETEQKQRTITVQDAAALCRAHPDRLFVSLNHTDAGNTMAARLAEIGVTNFRHYARATQTNDYDDTAGMVAALDAVVAVPCAAMHLAGALGVPTKLLVPAKASRWCPMQGDWYPWYESVTMYRQTEEGDWSSVIEAVAKDL
jgi:hypothetical protein